MLSGSWPRPLPFLLLAFAILFAACAAPGEATADDVGESPPVAKGTGGACPITIPAAFTPPKPYPSQPSEPNAVWYGTADLWTVLQADGAFVPRKGVWWSSHFQGGVLEQQPDIAVSWQRLDIEAPHVTTHSPGTNAYTEEDGWFMIADIHPDTPGCWKVTATYRNARLSYVYEVP